MDQILQIILAGGVFAALVGLIGVLIAQHRTTRRHNEVLRQDRELEAQRAEQAKEAEADRQRADALERYLEQMRGLLIDKQLRGSKKLLRRSEGNAEVHTFAQAQTLAVLERLDPDRRGHVVRFLQSFNLIVNRKDRLDKVHPPVVSLSNANLREANLRDANLKGANLEGANLKGANLQGANLEGAILWSTNLQGANLQGANLERAGIVNANLRYVNLQGTDLQGANLSYTGANLQGANLQGANLQRVGLKEVDLSGADLRETDLRETDLRETKGLTQTSLEHAIGNADTKLPEGLRKPGLWTHD